MPKEAPTGVEPVMEVLQNGPGLRGSPRPAAQAK